MMLRAILSHYWVFILAISYILLYVSGDMGWDEDDEDPVSTTEIDAVLGHSADLPCDISIRGEDRVYMVLWFRQNAGKPLYRYDVRGRNIENAIHWSDNEGFAERARFNGKTKPAHLHLEGVQLTDEGVYRCRVDFKNTPTKNYQVNLSVIVPPYAMSVYNRQGEVKDSVIGPLEEGIGLTLSCEVRGGKPAPTVSWFINNRIVEGRLKTEHNLVVNTLEIASVQRENLNDSYKCQAGNTKLILPAEKSLRLELTLKPQSVQIVNKPIRLVANQEHTFICHVAGSRPAPQVTWWSDTKSFNRGKIEEHSNETLVVSKLRFIPTPEDDDRGLKCRGENPVLKDASLEDTVSLNVVYPPMVTLRLGPKLKPNAIKEGDDVYFECKVRANPKEHKISWYHNGVPVKRNSSSGVILSTESLVLQRVSRHNTGRYTCQAVNERGETTSNPVALRVQYAPVCKSSEPNIVGASINEAVRVKCHVSSDPRDASFQWKFNNNGEDFHVNPAKYSEPNSSSSDLMYTPLSERDYGTLACWGHNSIGSQAEPCTFQVVPAVRPGALKNCTLRSTVNVTGDWLEIQCLAGYDGGLPQLFHLEALEATSHKLYANLTASLQPLFRLELSAMSSSVASPILQLILYASNLKGKSEVLLLEDIALRDPEKRTEWVTGVGAGSGGSAHSLIITACILIIVISIVLLACFLIVLRKRNASSSTDGGELIKTQLSHPNGGGMLDERYIVSYQLKTGGGGDKQPDILSRVSDDPLERDSAMSQCDYNSNAGVIASFMSPCDTPLEPLQSLEGALGPSRPQTLAYSPSSSSPLLNGNGTLRKSHHVLANNIPGPESCV